MLKPLSLLAAIVAALWCVLPAAEAWPGPAGDHGPLQQELSEFILRQMDEYNVPGVSIALVDDQTVLWAQGFGYADKQKKIPATAETVYEIGSITKPLTALLAMKLVEKGTLDLDRPLEFYLPAFSMKRIVPGPAPITLRAVLSHHAGLPRYFLKGMVSKQQKSLLDEGLNQDYVLYAPGTRFEYSNVGYALLRDVIQKQAGRPSADAADQELFQPLRMRHTAFSLQENIAPLMAKGYSRGKPKPLLSWRDGELLSSVLDLSRFLQMIFAGGTAEGRRILRKETLDAMFEPQFSRAELDFDVRYGLGWFLGNLPDFPGVRAAWHHGRTLSSWSKVLLARDKKLGVIVLCNADTGRVLVDAVARKSMELLLRLHPDARLAATPDPLLDDVIKAGPRPLAAYAGYYSVGGLLAQVSEQDGKLKLRARGHTLDLVPFGDGAFRVEKRLLGIIPLKIKVPPFKLVPVNGHDYVVTQDQGIRTGERLQPAVVPQAWKDRTGEYRLLNPDQDPVIHFKRVALLMEDGFLIMEVETDLREAQGKLVLKPVSDDVAYIVGANAAGGPNGAIVRRRAGDKDQLWFSGYAFERIEGNP